MNWRFWKNDNLLDKMNDMEGKLDNLEGLVSELKTNNKQMMRLQFKYNQEVKTGLTEIEQKARQQKSNTDEITKLQASLQQYQTLIEQNAMFLIDLIDEIDLVLQGLNEQETNWKRLLENWLNEVMDTLEKVNITEIELTNKKFNPKVAEAIKVIGPAGLTQMGKDPSSYDNNEIVQVLKRGYRNGSSNLIRKATVITFKDEAGDLSEV